MITPRPSKRSSTPRSIVLVDTILPSLAGQYLCATIRRRRPANAVVVSGPMKGLDLTQSMFEASNLDGSIISSLPQSRSSLILPYQGSMTSGQKPGFARNSVPMSCSQWEYFCFLIVYCKSFIRCLRMRVYLEYVFTTCAPRRREGVLLTPPIVLQPAGSLRPPAEASSTGDRGVPLARCTTR
jgi:hypothetical protein